jgi:hypothetical protein
MTFPGIAVFANQPTGTVTTGGTTTSDITFTVTVNNAFPTASATVTPNNTFAIMDPALPTEIMWVTAGTGSVGSQSWTVTRGAESTAAVAHAANWTCVQVVSADILAQFKQASAATTTPVTVGAVTTETVIASYTPIGIDIEAGATFDAIAFGSYQRLGTALTSTPTLTWRLRWGGLTGTIVTALVTGTNGPTAAFTTVAAGSSFDVNGSLTLIDTTHAVGNLNFWFQSAAATVNSLVSSNATSVVISGSGPLVLTFQFGGTLGGSQQLVASAPLIYRAA